ncbi:3'-5' exoribonuclease [Marilutibacter maris]|uniref:Uncharacterized protein n=1 Tax=Marilutibacter maris TaxID=1605891 RepID=A0A2U9T9Q7_9GAMM|nr:3'-5' exoribonuclease [Lysobacter maris]AWV06249.1 hypothetical protein C9I47_0526 [Lysobacter maris]
MTRLFLDCEWADNLGRELVSLALVSEDGQDRFYSEVSPLPKHPNDFVRAVVYPLLDHGFHARQPIDLTRDLRAFLSRISEPCVLFDHPVDGTLFGHVLDGFDLPVAALAHLRPVPKVVTTLIAECDAMRRQIDRYFIEHPEQVDRKHHAMVDAEALRWAYCRALKVDTP